MNKVVEKKSGYHWAWALVVWSALMAPAAMAVAAVPDPKGVEFFEQKIRPIFVEHCYDCHSQATKTKGGLMVDTREALLKGGDTGPAIVAGDTERSLLIKAVRYTDSDLQMPPKKKKLSSEQIAALEAWVKMGAPDPRVANGKPLSPIEVILEKAGKHWAFRPLQAAAVPKVKNTRWVKSPVDAFVLAKLEAKGMQPAVPADKRTLIRRACEDLTGLPPTPEELEDFLADKSPDAFAKVVDRLLASPRYGERWGRYWLDIARYADTKGYVFQEERRYPYSYTYRDYVINAFNQDKPYNEFLIEQLAADQLPQGADKSALAAMGFLTLGRRFLNNQQDIIDDRLDVVCRGLMGLTVGCARCHDHKFDPIPTRDYYSLYGVFSSSYEPEEKPLLGVIPDKQKHEAYLAERAKLEKNLSDYREKEEAIALTKLRASVGDYLLAAHELAGPGKEMDKLARDRRLEPSVVHGWISSLKAWNKTHSPIFAPWAAFAALPEKDFAAQAGALAARIAQNNDAAHPLNPVVAKAFAGEAPKSLKEVAERYGKIFFEIDKEWQDLLAGKKGDAPKLLVDTNAEALRVVLYGESSPVNIPSARLGEFLGTQVQQKLTDLKRKVDELEAVHPGAPPRAMVMMDADKPHNERVFVRGNPGNPGVEAPREFFQILAGKDRKPFQKGSGRLELAQAIASADNPLTPRVMVNRVWLHHFGTGLVRTPSDFGVRSDPPSHPELLDYLASRFIQEGWSIKKLHRAIMLTSAYEQSSDADARVVEKYTKLDPINELYWHMNRRRLDFEALRDSVLQVSGKLDLAAGGRAVEIAEPPFSNRRSVYGYIDRQNLPGLFRTFDFASPDTSNAQRFNTTVPQQALFMMNNPFIIDQARSFLQRSEINSLTDEESRVRKMYELAFQRQPSRDEVGMAKKFLAEQAALSAKSGPEGPAWQYGYGSYDEAAKRVKKFTPLPHFASGAWQGGPKLPDAKLSYSSLTAAGGHPGPNPDQAVMRRWIAPRDGTIAIAGNLSHPATQGDGVRGRIVSSRNGLLGEWIAFHSATDTPVAQAEVKKGDTIDFVTDCRTETGYDSFGWAPVVKYTSKSAYDMPSMTVTWDAQTDFEAKPKAMPKPLDAWEKFAQVLLISNELVFVD